MDERDFIFEGFKELSKEEIAALPLKERLQYLYLKERIEARRLDRLHRKENAEEPKTKLPMWECDVCGVECLPTNKNRHLKSKKHLESKKHSKVTIVEFL